MASKNLVTVSAFIEGAPPGEVLPITSTSAPMLPNLSEARRRGERCAPPFGQVKNNRGSSETDIKALTTEAPKLLSSAQPAFKKYNEEQLVTVQLPRSDRNVCA